MLQENIQDKKLLRYIARMFKAGILSEGELIVQEEGIVQGVSNGSKMIQSTG